MNNIYDKFDHIDKYLRQEFSPEELETFIQLLEKDSELKTYVEEEKELIDQLKAYHEKITFKSQLNEFHKNIDASNERKKTKAPVINLSVKLLQHAAIITVAASIALAVMFGILYKLGLFNYNNQIESYSELKNSVEKISSNQQSIWKTLLSNQDKKVETNFSGTCFSISENGYLITNNHLVRRIDTTVITNKFDELEKYTAIVIYRDIKHDLAVLQIIDSGFTGFSNIPYTIGKETIELGGYVYTLGFSKEDIVFGEGSISALTGFRGDSTSYQVSIPTNPGNSGGPVFNEYGELLGVISGKNAIKESATFAIRSDYIVAVVDSVSSKNLVKPIKPNSLNTLRKQKRTEQIKKLQPFIFKIESHQ